MHLSQLIFKKKSIFYFLIFCFIIGGVLSYKNISKLEDPEIVVMMANVVTVYPGASAHEVEMQVTSVLEKAISELADIECIRSKSSANVSIIEVELKMTVPQEEIPQRWEFLRRKVQKATFSLPKSVQTPMVIDDIGDVYGMFYAITADGFSYQEMSKQVQYLKDQILLVPGVRKVATYGEQASVINIIMTPEKMAQMGVLPIQIISAIQDYNLNLYAGALKIGDQQLRINVSGKVKSLEELKNILIKGLNGELIKLSDIATISRGYNDPLHNTFYVDNEKALGLSISMESGENIIELGERVEKRLSELKKQLPVGYKFTKVFFQPDEVEKSITDFMINLVLSVLIVVLILMLTMGLRSGLIIGGGLLLTILATFPFLLLAGGTLQRISLGAFIVAMGMLVDNAIVVIDGIIVSLQTKGRRKTSFTDPVQRTAWPLLGATIIAVAAFLPAVLSKDTAGTYVHDLFVVLCISLFISWLLALTQVPLFSAMFLKVKINKNDKEPYDGFMHGIVRKVLVFFLHHKAVTAIFSIILLAFTVYNFKNVKQTFFPDFNYSQAYIEYKLPYGTTAEKVQADLAEITNYLLRFDEVEQVFTSQGMTPTRYCLVRPLGDIGDYYGELIIDFVDYETMIRMKPQLEEYLSSSYPDAYTRIRKYNLSIKSSHTVEAQFSGSDPAILRKLSDSVQKIMHHCPYTDKPTISADWNPMGKSLKAKYAMDAARRNGTNRSDISYALLSATDGLPLGIIYDGETPLEMKLKMRKSDGSKISNLKDIPVWNILPSIDGIDKNSIMGLMYGLKSMDEFKSDIFHSVPLSGLTSSMQIDWEEQVVCRVNGRRTIEAQCEPLEGYAPELVRGDILEKVEAIPLPDGYNLKWIGEYELQGTALKNVFSFLPITIMIIVFVLILLFNDYKRPLIVLLCIPMAVVGIVPALILTGQPYTFIAIIGTFGLIGMLVKNSIVLLDEIAKQISEGMGQYDAIVNATVSRARPVIMASMTTILGMIPLFFDPMYSSMAVTIISGLLFGTAITLIFVPLLYAMFYRVNPNL